MSKHSDLAIDIGLFVVLLAFIIVGAGGAAYMKISEDRQENTRSRQCLELGKDWVDGNCVTPPK